VVESHFRGLICLIVWFVPLFMLLCLVLLVWEVFADFDLVSPKQDGVMKILRPYGSKNVAKEALRDPTRTNHDMQQNKWGRTSVTNGQHYLTMVVPMVHGELCSPRATRFLYDYSCSNRLDIFIDFFSSINTLFLASLHHHIYHSIQFNILD